MDTNSELRAVRGRVLLRDNSHLLAQLAAVDDEGWDGPVATDLLHLVRVSLVRPLVVRQGLRGAVAGEAESSGWAAAWEALRSPSLRDSRSPWGVVWSAARRAVMAEVVEARYATSARKAWAAHADHPDGAAGWKSSTLDDSSGSPPRRGCAMTTRTISDVGLRSSPTNYKTRILLTSAARTAA